MKRQFRAIPSIIQADSISKGFTLDPDKVADAAQGMWDGRFDEICDSRIEDLDWSMYDSIEELAFDIPMLLWVICGLQDGEDYQLLNSYSVLPTDPSNQMWEVVNYTFC